MSQWQLVVKNTQEGKALLLYGNEPVKLLLAEQANFPCEILPDSLLWELLHPSKQSTSLNQQVKVQSSAEDSPVENASVAIVWDGVRYFFTRHPFTDDDQAALILFLGGPAPSELECQAVLNDGQFLSILTNNLPDMLWAKDLEGRYLFANQAICDNLLMANNIEEPIGKNDMFFAQREREKHADNPAWHTFGELCFNSDEVVIENMKAMAFEEYGNIRGELCYLDVHKAPLFDAQGQLIGTVGSGRDITLQKALEVQLERQAFYDELTGLPNRNLFWDRLKKVVDTNTKSQSKVAVLVFDLDNFKEINDAIGHQVGDLVLIEIAKKLSILVSEGQTLARLGGDEFGLIIQDIKGIASLAEKVSQYIDLMAAPIIIDDHVFYVTLSIGVAIFPDDGLDANSILKNADAALFKAKADGRNHYQFYSQEMTQKALERVALESSLRAAIQKKEFEVFYQPQMQIINGVARLSGLEALVRWRHPQLGLLSPAQFIPLAEETGLIIPLDRLVMEQAISQVAQWDTAGLDWGVLSLNVAPHQLEREDFSVVLASQLKQYGVAAERIMLEVTESQIMQNPDKAIAMLKQLRALGFGIAIDDFGTGYSSLSYLKKLPLNKLKIDQSFVRDLPEDEDDTAITRAVIALGKSLGLSLIAEGVETAEQQHFILQNGCDTIQGFFYSRPLPAAEMSVLLSAKA
ncbi:sensor domain-containing protein [Thiosulfativibrio zosterae]|uniref:cyclic-guanylate-specific phosphodiesterase n=1 Tax=Thiosulfativibrio zosterae TaxID=2675053 RepID=A0A6F8PQQ6_9GAMM|nr:GGDEF and EAL domain-containing protein [Thiosulfativibrio zosterae]BBP44416.1 hypothetical protein THMIRHAT_21620 [Thiosulfativibrio zosterae]